MEELCSYPIPSIKFFLYLKKIEDISDLKKFSSNQKFEKKLTDLNISTTIKYKADEKIVHSKEFSELLLKLNILGEEDEEETDNEQKKIAEYEGYIYKIRY